MNDAVLDFPRADDARLAGWNGPFFPPAIDALNRVLDWHEGLHITTLAKVLERMDDLVGVESLVTDDEHLWCAKLEFKLGERRVIVAVPNFSPKERQLARSTAIYSDRPISDEILNTLVQRVADWLGPNGA